MKTIRVVAGIIKLDNKILATQRTDGIYKGRYEFPGGKIEEHETKEEALIREIKEELTLDIKVNEFVHTINFDYPTFHLEMDCYFCEIINGEISLSCHSDYKWITKAELDSLNWLDADIELIELLKTYNF